MNNTGNHKWIGALMLVSQLLLCAFVFQWLSVQYKTEKENFEEELGRQFNTSKQQVLDSMILTTLIDPVLKDKAGTKVRVEIRDDSIAPRSKHLNGIQIIESDERKDSVARKDIGQGVIDKMITLKGIPHSKEELLLHGVNLMYKVVSSNYKDSISLDEKFYFKTDTLLLKKTVAGNLARNRPDLDLEWIAGKEKKEGGKHHAFLYFESNLFSSPYGVAVSGYQLYVFRKITPQFLFALVLLLLTGAAFFLAYRSMLNQTRLNILRNDFISNISHELKTPVSTVKVAIEALKDFNMKQNPVVAQEYLEMAASEMSRLELLMDKVLTTSILEDEKQFMKTERRDLKKIAEDLLGSMQLVFERRNAMVQLESSGQEFYSDIDKLQVEGVLLNLLDNSLKYGPEKPKIIVKLEKNDHENIISVSDNGPGIPKEYLNKVFEKFFRVPTGNLHSIKGYGLGLSHAALVMKQHRGNIRAENLAAGGCMFTLRFPAIQA